MKIIEPSATLVDEINPDEILLKLEACGRVSHQSQPREGSTEKFVRMLIKRGHESVLEHVSLTFRIICDRAIQNELVRHRHASFTVESTRYVKYDELEVIAPRWQEQTFLYRKWYSHMREVENTYKDMIEHGARPEDARSVLSNCVKSELYMTCNLREWRWILKQRTDKAAHPQMRQIMNQVLAVFKEKLPVIVEDINYDS
ncbi:MAG: FAD-dependent thymidylate synthase [Selenomonadaceae bacterium]|nr:FAD-dependent thymidylate synthase [Selenomonadaceae bacterium]